MLSPSLNSNEKVFILESTDLQSVFEKQEELGLTALVNTQINTLNNANS